MHLDIKPGCGLTDEMRDAAAAIMHSIIPSMFKAQQPWAVMGSFASVLQGIENYTPPDIDLVTTMEGAYIMESCIGTAGASLRPVALSTGGPYTSHFGIFEVLGVKVEVMGDLVIKCDDGYIDCRDHWSRWSDKVRVLHFEDMHIPVVPLEWQLVANMLLRRPERCEGIAKYLLEHGYDGTYMQDLLSDEHNGLRTIAGVREALGLGG
jgi:hypothetical protein